MVGALSNLAFLAVLGAVAEQVLTRPRWLAHYFGVGLLAELVAYAWQPKGGGNSIAICGLTGAVALACWRGDERLPAYAPLAVLIWCGALLGTLYRPLIVVGVAATGLALRRRERGLEVLRPTAIAVSATGVVLAIAANIHGAALLMGTALALITVAGLRPR